MLTDTLQQKIQDSFKKGDELRTTTLKLLYAALHNGEIAKIAKLTEEEELKIIISEVKKRKDAIDLYNKIQDPNSKIQTKIEREQKELAILMEYMPKQMSEAELGVLVNEVIIEMNAATMADMGKVIGAVKARAGAGADGSVIAQLVKTKLA